MGERGNLFPEKLSKSLGTSCSVSGQTELLLRPRYFYQLWSPDLPDSVGLGSCSQKDPFLTPPEDSLSLQHLSPSSWASGKVVQGKEKAEG